jgi:hypothetical protein
VNSGSDGSDCRRHDLSVRPELRVAVTFCRSHCISSPMVRNREHRRRPPVHFSPIAPILWGGWAPANEGPNVSAGNQ